MTMEDDYDIYGDLDGLEAEVDKDNKVVRELNAQIDELKFTIEQKESEKQDIASKNAILLENISSLLLTAKAELKRKDTLIADIRREKDNIAFRRGGAKMVRKHDKYTQTELIRMLDRDMQTDMQSDVRRERSPPGWNQTKCKPRSRSKSTERNRERINYRNRSRNSDRLRNPRDKSKGQRANRNEREMPAWERERLQRREQEREKEQRARRGPRSPDSDRRHPVVRFQSPVRLKSEKVNVPDSASDIAISKTFIPMNRSELDRYVKEIGRSENRSPVPRRSRSTHARRETLESSNSELWDKTQPVKVHNKVKRTPVAEERKLKEQPTNDSNVELKEEMIQSDEIGTTASNASSSPVKAEEQVEKLLTVHREPMVRIPARSVKTEDLEEKLLALHGKPIIHFPPLPKPVKSEELEQMPPLPKYEELERMYKPPLPKSEPEKMPPLPECEEPEQRQKPPLPQPVISEELEKMPPLSQCEEREQRQQHSLPETVISEEVKQIPLLPESEELEQRQKPSLPELAKSEELEQKLLVLHGETMVQIPPLPVAVISKELEERPPIPESEEPEQRRKPSLPEPVESEELEQNLLALHGDSMIQIPPISEHVTSEELETMSLLESEEPEQRQKSSSPEHINSEELEQNVLDGHGETIIQIPPLSAPEISEELVIMPRLFESEEPEQRESPLLAEPVKSEELEQKLLALHGETIIQIPHPLECHQTSIELLEGLRSEDNSQMLDASQPPTLIIPPPEPPIIEQVPELPIDEDPKLNDSRELKIIESDDIATEQEDDKNSSAETVIEKQSTSFDDELEEGEVISPPPSVTVCDNEDEGFSDTDPTEGKMKSHTLKEAQKDANAKHKRKLTKSFHKSTSKRRHHHRSRSHSQRRSLRDQSATSGVAIRKTKHSERSRSTSRRKSLEKKKNVPLKGLFGSDEESLHVPASGSKRKHSRDSKRDRESKKRKEESSIVPIAQAPVDPADDTSNKLFKQNAEPSEPLVCLENIPEKTSAAENNEKQSFEQAKVQDVIILSSKYGEYRIEVNNEEETTVYLTRKKKKKGKSKNASLNSSGIK